MAIDRTLHKYTLGEELVNAISHGLGAAAGIVGLIFLIISSVGHGASVMVGNILFGASMIILYLGSCIYHALKRNGAKKVFRILDHCFVYLLIIGTYAPYSIAVVGGVKGYLLYIINCCIGVVGITFTAIDMKKFSKLSMPCYIVMGWLILMNITGVYSALPKLSFYLLLFGGVVYTLGAVVYALGRKARYIHSVWHFMVLIANVMHYFSILYFTVTL